MKEVRVVRMHDGWFIELWVDGAIRKKRWAGSWRRTMDIAKDLEHGCI